MSLGLGLTLSSQGSECGGFSPDQIENLALWLRADSGVTKDGSDDVSQWDFKNGAFRGQSNVAQATGANQPDFNASNSSYANKPTIDFNGSSDFLTSGNFSSDLTQPTTYFAVGNMGGSAQNIFDGATATERNALYRGAVNFGAYAGSVLNGPAGDSNPHIFELILDGVSSELVTDGVSSGGDANTQDLRALSVGANPTPGNYLTGSIAEIIVYTGEVSAADRTLIREYLGGRYAITI